MGRASASYYICQVKDTDGTITFEAIRTSEVKARMEVLRKDYVTAYKAWKADKSGDKPGKPAFRKVSSKKVYGQSKAQSLASLCQERWDEKMKKKEAKAQEESTDDEKT